MKRIAKIPTKTTAMRRRSRCTYVYSSAATIASVLTARPRPRAGTSVAALRRRSRMRSSEALAWCVRLVARHQGEWIDSLREALVHVEKVRSEGPDA